MSVFGVMNMGLQLYSNWWHSYSWLYLGLCPRKNLLVPRWKYQ